MPVAPYSAASPVSGPGLFPASAHHCCFGHHRFLRFQCDGEGARLTTFTPVFRWSFQNNAGRYGTGELKGCREHRFTGNHLPSVPRGTLYIVANGVRFGKGKDKEGGCDGIKGIDFPQGRRHGAALAGAVGRQEVEEAAQLDWAPDQTSSEIGLIT